MEPLVLVVQNSADDPPGRLGRWLREAGCVLDVVRCHLGEELPSSLKPYQGFVVLGGGMGAYDDAEVSWLTATKSLLREATQRQVATLSICLGHQLLAVANGGRVARARVPQNGVVPVGVTAHTANDALFAEVPSGAIAVHWNNDVVVSTPPGAVVLASSAAGVQAFRLGTSAWGVQFHPEVDVQTVTAWADEDVLFGRMSAQLAEERLAVISSADDRLEPIWHAFADRFGRLLALD